MQLAVEQADRVEHLGMSLQQQRRNLGQQRAIELAHADYRFDREAYDPVADPQSNHARLTDFGRIQGQAGFRNRLLPPWRHESRRRPVPIAEFTGDRQ